MRWGWPWTRPGKAAAERARTGGGCGCRDVRVVVALKGEGGYGGRGGEGSEGFVADLTTAAAETRAALVQAFQGGTKRAGAWICSCSGGIRGDMDYGEV